MSVSFDDVLARLPSIEDETSVAVVRQGVRGVRDPATVQATDKYVKPSFSREGSAATPLQAPVLLITAPAAVGKTALAEQLSAKSGCPLWELGSLSLGTYVLPGTITEAYGPEATGHVLSGLKEGRLALVLDGADEAYVSSGLDGLEWLVSDIANYCPSSPATSRASFVVLGRYESITWTAALLEDRGISFDELRIDFFDDDSSLALIDLIAAPSEGAENPAYLEARTAVLEAVRRPIEADQESRSRSFLGYAPVLIALGTFLSDKNPAQVSQHVAAEIPGSGVWQILDLIVEGILVRERHRLLDALSNACAEALGEHPAFFDPAYQESVLISRTPTSRALQGVPQMRDDLRQELEEAVIAQLAGHPFVTTLDASLERRFVNVVFRDHVAASALAADDPDAVVTARELYGPSGTPPSPLLAQFLLRSDETGEATRYIEGEDAGLVHEALVSSRETEQEPVRFAYAPREGDADVEALVSGSGDRVAYTVKDGAIGHLFFRQSISHTVIDLPDCWLTLGSGSHEVLLGPAVDLRCDELTLEASSLHVADGESSSVAIEAETVRTPIPLNAVKGGTSRFKVLSNRTPAYPLSGFWQQRHSSGPDGEAIENSLLALRKLLLWFTTGPSQRLGYPVKPLRAAVGRGRISEDMLDFALETRLLREKNRTFVAYPEQVGLDLRAVRSRELTPAIEDYLQKYLNWAKSRG